MAERHTIPARKGLALRVPKGQRYKVLNTHGTQIVDHWAFNGADVKEFMSMEHCRVAIDKLTPVVGDAMVTNKRRPIITLVEDTSPGVHDTLVAACDIYRYQQLGALGITALQRLSHRVIGRVGWNSRAVRACDSQS